MLKPSSTCAARTRCNESDGIDCSFHGDILIFCFATALFDNFSRIFQQALSSPGVARSQDRIYHAAVERANDFDIETSRVQNASVDNLNLKFNEEAENTPVHRSIWGFSVSPGSIISPR
jgi:hypothetical protein